MYVFDGREKYPTSAWRRTTVAAAEVGLTATAAIVTGDAQRTYDLAFKYIALVYYMRTQPACLARHVWRAVPQVPLVLPAAARLAHVLAGAAQLLALAQPLALAQLLSTGRYRPSDPRHQPSHIHSVPRQADLLATRYADLTNLYWRQWQVVLKLWSLWIYCIPLFAQMKCVHK